MKRTAYGFIPLADARMALTILRLRITMRTTLIQFGAAMEKAAKDCQALTEAHRKIREAAR